MAAPARINVALAATLISSGVSLEDAALQCGAKNANVLRVVLARKGVTVRQAQSLELVGDRKANVTMSIVSEASRALRAQFANELAQTASKLSEIPAKADLKSLRQRAEVLEPLARTAKIVHDWGSEQPNALVVAGLFSEPRAQETLPAATDIQAVVCDAPIPDQDKPSSLNPS